MRSHWDQHGDVHLFRAQAPQFPFNVRDRIAQYLDVRPSQIRVIGHTIGGGFGANLDASIEPHACALSKAAGGLPVKIVNTRAEDMLTCPSREDAVTRIRTALDADGNMTARELEVIAGATVPIAGRCPGWRRSPFTARGGSTGSARLA